MMSSFCLLNPNLSTDDCMKIIEESTNSKIRIIEHAGKCVKEMHAIGDVAGANSMVSALTQVMMYL